MSERDDAGCWLPIIGLCHPRLASAMTDFAR
jgi:hypothetical protein